MPPNWALIDDEDGRPIHVVPVNDIIDHEDSAQCWCAPKVEAICSGKMITHNSADGREDFERRCYTTHTAKRKYLDS